jgi:hypothetical protein
MITRKDIYNIHRKRDNTLSRHAKLSANILSRITRELDKHPLPYRLDYEYPYHLIVNCNRLISVYASGMNKRIDVLHYLNSGKPASGKYERGFMTPKGAVNYIIKKWGSK